MIRVLVNRDGVGRGDSAEGRSVDWELPDDTSLGDVVLALVDRHFLADVRGSVAWVVQAHHGGDTWCENLAAVLVPSIGDVQVATLTGVPMTTAVREHVEASGTGGYAFAAHLVRDVVVSDLEDFRAEIEDCDTELDPAILAVIDTFRRRP